jgi:hypothetical protein
MTEESMKLIKFLLGLLIIGIILVVSAAALGAISKVVVSAFLLGWSL